MSNNKIVKENTLEVYYQDKIYKFESPEASGNVLRQLKKGRFYELKLLKYINSLNLEGTYIDVGANIGNHSIFFDLCTKSQKVYSFEASPMIYKYLKKNIKNNKSRCELYNLAIGEKKGKCHIVQVNKDIIGGSKTESGGSIDMDSLDNLLNEKENVSLVKIDVEGGEMGVLKGMSRILKNDKPEIILEASNKEQKKLLSNELKEFGYYPVEVFNNTATYHFTTKLKQNKVAYSIFKRYIPRRIFRNS